MPLGKKVNYVAPSSESLGYYGHLASEWNTTGASQSATQEAFFQTSRVPHICTLSTW